MAITPTREQFTEFAHGTREGEVVMINLLHFARPDDDGRRRRRRRPTPTPTSSGAGAYREYSDQVVKMVEARGGKVIWTGRPEHVLIGDSDGRRLGPGGAGVVPQPRRLHRHGHVAEVRGGPHRTASAGSTAPCSWPASRCSNALRPRDEAGADDA